MALRIVLTGSLVDDAWNAERGTPDRRDAIAMHAASAILRAVLTTPGVTLSIPASLAPLAAAAAVDISQEDSVESGPEAPRTRIEVTDRGASKEDGFRPFVEWLEQRSIHVAAEDEGYPTPPEVRAGNAGMIVFLLGGLPRRAPPVESAPTTAWVYFSTLLPERGLEPALPGRVVDGDSLLPRMRDAAAKAEGRNVDMIVEWPELPEGEAAAGSRYGIVAEHVIAAKLAGEPLEGGDFGPRA
jgi:hypothetical protein